MESSAKTRRPLHSIGIIYSSPSLSLWYNLSLIFTCTNGGESNEGSQSLRFLAINAKVGDSISPKQKDRTTTQKIQKNLK
jgi:G:T/U-mismatch repair DNA glycosylase